MKYLISVGVMLVTTALLAKTVTTTTVTTVTTTEEEESKAEVVEPVAAPVEEVPVAEPEEVLPPPPPEPSAADAAEPRKLIRYFCRMWKEEEYEAMYWAMTPKYRSSMPLEKFQSRFEKDAELTGGLNDENMTLRDDDLGKTVTVVVDLTFNNKRMKARRVKTVLEKTKEGYRIKSGLVPIDLKSL